MGLFSGILTGIGSVFGGPIGGAIGGLAGGLFDSNQAEQGVQDQNAANLAAARETNQFNAGQADINRDWLDNQAKYTSNFNSAQSAVNREFQKDMSSTSYQRAVKDMEAAGLNPMLAYSQGGAATPSGSSASIGVPSGSSASGVQARMENKAAAALSMGVTLKDLENRTKMNDAMVDKVKADTVVSEASAGNVAKSTEKMSQEIPKIKAEMDNLIEQAMRARAEAGNADARTELAKIQTTLTRFQVELTSVETEFKKGQITYQEAQKKLTEIQTVMTGINAQIARPEAEKADTTWGKAAPYVQDILKVVPFMGGKK